MELEALQLVEFAYNRQRGEPRYIPFRHRGVPPRYPAFELQLPVLLLPWDDERGGVMCFAHPLHQAPLTSEAANQDETALLGVCRCGVVRFAKYFQRGRLDAAPTYDVALKIMDKTQLKLQHDDVLNEVRAMAQLQPPGFAGVYHSPHLSQWECLADEHNEYIAMDWAANGSLIMYAKRRLTDYKRFAVERLVNRMTSLPELEQAVNTFVARAWMLEALHIFEGEVRAHNQHPSPRPGFLEPPRTCGLLEYCCTSCCVSDTPRVTWLLCAIRIGRRTCSHMRTNRATTDVSDRKAASFASATSSSQT
ncbi:Protein kinase-like domain [Phytophthora cactorum]|nr:Protein kinase-like domain [Phytophthora cactorum]